MLQKITILEELHIHAFSVRPPARPPKSEAPRGVPLGGAEETESPRDSGGWAG